MKANLVDTCRQCHADATDNELARKVLLDIARFSYYVGDKPALVFLNRINK